MSVSRPKKKRKTNARGWAVRNGNLAVDLDATDMKNNIRMTVTHNKEVDNAIRDLAQSLRGENKRKLMCIVVELGNRVRECEKYRGKTRKKGAGPVLSDYAKQLVQKKILDEIANQAKTTETDLEAYVDPARVNCNQHLG